MADKAYIAGDFFSAADIMALSIVDFGTFIGTPIPDDCSHLKAWHERVSARPSAAGAFRQECTKVKQRLRSIMLGCSQFTSKGFALHFACLEPLDASSCALRLELSLCRGKACGKCCPIPQDCTLLVGSLAVTKRFSELLGGRVEIRSRIGHGTQANLFVPVFPITKPQALAA
eukprot:gene19736-39201_t